MGLGDDASSSKILANQPRWAELAHQTAHQNLGTENSYAESLKWLRCALSEYCLVGAAGGLFPADVSGWCAARLRLLLACMSLNLPEATIRSGLPGIDWMKIHRRRRGAAYMPDRTTVPDPEPLIYGEDSKAWVKRNLERYTGYLQSEVRKSEVSHAELLRRGKIREQITYVPLRPQHRKRALDLAERCLVTARVKILKHPYIDIAIDRGQVTDQQVYSDVSRLKVAVHAAWKEAYPPRKKG